MTKGDRVRAATQLDWLTPPPDQVGTIVRLYRHAVQVRLDGGGFAYPLKEDCHVVADRPDARPDHDAARALGDAGAVS